MPLESIWKQLLSHFFFSFSQHNCCSCDKLHHVNRCDWSLTPRWMCFWWNWARSVGFNLLIDGVPHSVNMNAWLGSKIVQLDSLISRSCSEFDNCEFCHKRLLLFVHVNNSHFKLTDYTSWSYPCFAHSCLEIRWPISSWDRGVLRTIPAAWPSTGLQRQTSNWELWELLHVQVLKQSSSFVLLTWLIVWCCESMTSVYAPSVNNKVAGSRQ